MHLPSLSHPGAVRGLIAAASVTLALAHPAVGAAPVFQSIADLSGGNTVIESWCSSCNGRFRIFDQFTLTSTNAITGFSVSVYSLDPYWPVDVNFSIWSVASGDLPDVQLFSQTIAAADFTSSALSVNALLATTDDLNGLVLDAGTYFVSFYNPTNLGINGYFGGGGKLYQAENAFHAGTSAGFILYGGAANPVPEPSTMLLTGLALLALGVNARRRQG